MKAQRLLDEGQLADATRGDFLAVAHQRQFGAAEDVGALFAGANASVIPSFDHSQFPLLLAAVLDLDNIARAGGAQESFGRREQSGNGGQGTGIVMLGHQCDTRGRDHCAACILANAPPDHVMSPVDRTGPQLGTGQIHGHFAVFARLLVGLLHVGDHTLPLELGIVGAIHAHDVHARLDQAFDKFVRLGGLRWHGDHDANPTTCGNRPQEMVRLLGQDGGTGGEVDGVRMPRWIETLRAIERLQDGDDGVESGQHARLAASQ